MENMQVRITAAVNIGTKFSRSALALFGAHDIVRSPL